MSYLENIKLITQTEGGQRRYYLEGVYLPARKVKEALREKGFSGKDYCSRILRKLEERVPLSEGEVRLINMHLDGSMRR